MNTTTPQPMPSQEISAIELAERIIARGGPFAVWTDQDVRNVTETLKEHVQHEAVAAALQLLSNPDSW